MAITSSFSKSDFDIFLIDGLEKRMNALKQHIRPKFEEIAEHVSPFLTMLFEEPSTTHIAKHARRTVNPPDETWVAWSTNRRGYKAHPHFQVGLNKDYLFICFALIYECTKKPLFAQNMNRHKEVWSQIPNHYYISHDHTKPDFTLKGKITEKELQSMLERLKKVKQAEFLCGLHVSKEDIITMAIKTFETTFPLYLLAKEGD